MNLLAFDTSTELLTVAVQHGDAVRSIEGEGGPRASTALIPAIQESLAQCGLGLRELDAIVFGRGPGSFTGLRTACSVAQGMAFGAGVPVLGVETLMAVAEAARVAHGATQVVAVLDARMDEIYAATYEIAGAGWQRTGPIQLMKPEALVVPPGWALAGNAFAAYADRLASQGPRFPLAPSARALLQLAPTLIAAGQATAAAQATPLYIRDKVAQTSEERAAVRAAKG